MLVNDDIRGILTTVKTIAVVGWSPKVDRPSHGVARFLAARGYRVIPVNPGQAGQDVGLSAPVAASLADIGEAVDMVDIFRRSEEVYGVVEDGLAIGASVIWMQLGIMDDKAAALARAQGAKVVMNACPAIEIPRLGL
ncbi:MAG: CoA-binding protein [Cypionkella sp.]|nr:CoA-binding protein [Cypionkella sp.]